MDRSSIELSSEITAIGPFRPGLALVEHKDGSYDAPVVVELFSMAENSDESTELAGLLGITDVWDFDQHKIDARRVDVRGLRVFLAKLEFADEFLRDLATFERLRDADFDFYFRPIGRLRWETLELDHLYPARPPWRDPGPPVPTLPFARLAAFGQYRREVGEALGWPPERLRWEADGSSWFQLFTVIGAAGSAEFASIVGGDRMVLPGRGSPVDAQAVDVAHLRRFLATLPNGDDNLWSLMAFEVLRRFGFVFTFGITAPRAPGSHLPAPSATAHEDLPNERDSSAGRRGS